MLRRQFLLSAAPIPGILSGILRRAPLDLPDSATTGELAGMGTVAATSAAHRFRVIAPKDDRPSLEPKRRGEYRVSRHVYVDEGARWVRRFAVHGPDDSALPQLIRVAQFYGVLWRRIESRLSTTPTKLKQGSVDVWLTQDGEAGGEQYDKNIALYQYAAERTDLEWARELCHEYGHWLLPSPADYTDPEPWGNGLLGERLFMAWLEEDLKAKAVSPDELPWGGSADLRYYLSRQTEPLIRRMLAQPPNPALLSQRSSEAMDAYTALMLHTEKLHGPRAVFDLLTYLPRRADGRFRGDQFLTAIQAWATAETRILNVSTDPEVRLFLPIGETLVVGKVELTTLDASCRIKRTSESEISLKLASAKWVRLTVRGNSQQVRLIPAGSA